jgi:hypothetical protein
MTGTVVAVVIIRKKLQLGHLLLHRLGDLRPVVSAYGGEQRGEGVQILLPVHIHEITAVSPDEYLGLFLDVRVLR